MNDFISKKLPWIIIGLTILGIIGIKSARPETDLGVLVPIGIGIIVVTLVVFFWKNIGNLFKQAESELTKLNENDIKEIIINHAHSQRMNNIKLEKPYEWVKTRTINNDLIYAIKVNLNLEDESFISIINASEPRISPTFIDSYDENNNLILRDSQIVDQLMNDKARQPEGKPNITRVTTRKDEFGRPEEQKEEIKYEKEEKEKEDLL